MAERPRSPVGDHERPDYEDTFSAYLGLQLEAPDDEGVVRATVDLRPGFHQPMGITHGGIYAAIAEEVASASTYALVSGDGRYGLGQSNLTHFLRPSRAGRLHVVARPQHTGRSSWVWSIEMLDDEGRRCAVSTVTMAVRPMPA